VLVITAAVRPGGNASKARELARIEIINEGAGDHEQHRYSATIHPRLADTTQHAHLWHARADGWFILARKALVELDETALHDDPATLADLLRQEQRSSDDLADEAHEARLDRDEARTEANELKAFLRGLLKTIDAIEDHGRIVDADRIRTLIEDALKEQT
jgi:hypothetical protein